jgi:hypothetical protein
LDGVGLGDVSLVVVVSPGDQTPAVELNGVRAGSEGEPRVRGMRRRPLDERLQGAMFEWFGENVATVAPERRHDFVKSGVVDTTERAVGRQTESRTAAERHRPRDRPRKAWVNCVQPAQPELGVAARDSRSPKHKETDERAKRISPGEHIAAHESIV